MEPIDPSVEQELGQPAFEPKTGSESVERKENTTRVREASFTTGVFFGGAPTGNHFIPVLKLGRIRIWVSDGTTPSGNLKGKQGDICFGGASGRAYYCTSVNGTSWTAL